MRRVTGYTPRTLPTVSLPAPAGGVEWEVEGEGGRRGRDGERRRSRRRRKRESKGGCQDCSLCQGALPRGELVD